MAQIHDADAQISKGVMIRIAGLSLASVAADSSGDVQNEMIRP
jgi:hypothetical protein